MNENDSTNANATDTPTESVQIELAAEFQHDVPLTTCRIDPLGRFAFAGAEDFNVYRWDLGGGPESKTVFSGHQSWVRSFDFSPDGQWLYTGGYDDHIGVWRTLDSTVAPAPVNMIEAHRGWVRWVRVSPDGARLASCGNDNLVKVWSLPDGTLEREFVGHERFPYAVAWHPDGQRLVSFDLMGVIREWDVATGEVLHTLEAKVMWGFDEKFRADMGGARDLQFSLDGKTLAVAGLTEVSNAFAGVHKPMILLLDWEQHEQAHQFKDDDYKGMAWGVRFHPDGFLIGVGAPQGGNKGLLWFFRPGEDEAFHTFTLTHCGRGLDLTPDARRLAVAQFDGWLRVYDVVS